MSKQERTEREQQQLQAIAEQVLKMFSGNVYSLRQQRGVSDEEIESVYALAHGYYRAGRLEEAEQAFLFLCLFEHLETKHWIGLGAVQQLKGQYDKAVASYSYASIIDFTNPRALFHGAECHLALKHYDDALETLSALLAVCPEGDERLQTWRERGSQLQAQVEMMKKEANTSEC